jgi:hypothetical protein
MEKFGRGADVTGENIIRYWIYKIIRIKSTNIKNTNI